MNRQFKFDRITILLYALLVIAGWMTIYAVTSVGGDMSIFAWKMPHGRQLIWMGVSAIAAFVILTLDHRFLEGISYIVYGVGVSLILAALLFGKEINGARSWIFIAGQPFQPSEFAKVGTAMALARYMSALNFSLSDRRNALVAAAIVVVPAIIVILQNDTGSALVFGSFMFVFFREGLNPVIPIAIVVLAIVGVLTLAIANQFIVWGIIIFMGMASFLYFNNKRNTTRILALHVLGVAFLIGISFSTNFLVSKLAPHQQMRIKVLFNSDLDPRGIGYNVNQSKIAIGSGGFFGKGFLNGSYTKYKFVPKQDTDFIFCTVGEEYGWVGSLALLGLFFGLLFRLKQLSELSKTRFARIYGYSVISILFFHVAVNMGMTIGLVPVIGIPLPFFSYGGSSLLAFTVLIFILVNLYSFRNNVLGMKY